MLCSWALIRVQNCMHQKVEDEILCLSKNCEFAEWQSCFGAPVIRSDADDIYDRCVPLLP